MFKKEVSEYLEKIPEDEPVFILRGQDALAGKLVMAWSNQARDLGVNNHKAAEAWQCGFAMMKWLPRKLPD